jgi:hypothetical protein
LRDQGFAGPIDGVDLSPQMLQAALAKGLYRALYCADVTAPMDLPGGYTGIVSSGTFTSGHVGPEALPHLIALAAPGAVLALSVNLRIWEAQGFGAALQSLGAAIGPAQMLDVPIYGRAAATLDPDHAQDRARIVILRRL